MTAMWTEFANHKEPQLFGPQHPVTVMRSGFDPCCPRADEVKEPS